MNIIKLGAVRWVLGDVEETTHATTTVRYRPLFYRISQDQEGQEDQVVRVGSISPEYAEVLMDALNGGVE